MNILRSTRRQLRPRNIAAAAIVGGLVLASTVSASATAPGNTMTGRAYGLTASLGLLDNPESTLIAPVPDTGTVTSTDTTTTAPTCKNIPTGVIVVQALCVNVSTHKVSGKVTSVAELAELKISVPGLPAIELRGVKARSSITCDSNRGSTTVAFLKIGGNSLISRKVTFSNGATLTVGPIKIVFNETTRTGPPTRSRLVNAVHITADVPHIADLDVIVSSAYAAVSDCPTAPTD